MSTPPLASLTAPGACAALVWFVMCMPAAAQVDPAPPLAPPMPATFSCPLKAGASVLPKSATPRVVEDAACLVPVAAIDLKEALFDLRERDDYVRFHIDRAQHATVGSLAITPGIGNRRVIVYDSGRFRSDAFLLCDRLRHAGVTQVKVIDGGIMAWAQRNAPSELLALNRLSDAEVATALLDARGRVVVLSESLRAALPTLPMGGTPAPIAMRTVLVADPQLPIATVAARLARAPALYWVGTGAQLRTLVSHQLAQEKKRLAGPAESRTCSAL